MCESCGRRYHNTIADKVDAGADFRAIKQSIHSIPVDILPMFDIEHVWWFKSIKDRGGRDIWFDLEPAFRLASAIMTHPDVLPFWHGMAVAAAKYKRDAAQGMELPEHYVFDAKDTLTPDEAHETLQFLENFGKHVYVYEDDTGAAQGEAWHQLITERDGADYDPNKPLWYDVHGKRTGMA